MISFRHPFSNQVDFFSRFKLIDLEKPWMCQFRSLGSPSFAPLSVSAEFRSIFAFRLIFKKISKIAKRERFHSSAPHMLSIFFFSFSPSREFSRISSWPGIWSWSWSGERGKRRRAFPENEERKEKRRLCQSRKPIQAPTYRGDLQ